MGFDRKYGRVTAERKAIPDDEPVIVIRAQDAMACPAIAQYYMICEKQGVPDGHLAAIQATYRTFADWQEAHPDQVKAPDTEPGEYT